MRGSSSTPDVVVIGGGPAGSVAASLLAARGHRVLVLERERFPRYHIGESLLSATLPILDAIGVTPAIERHGFLHKPGGTFRWGRQAEPWSFRFAEDPGGRPHAYQVVRAEFDQLLLENARACGAEVEEECSVVRVALDDAGPVVHARHASGGERTLTPSFLVDASGQQALIGRANGLRRLDPFFRNLAVFGYFRDAERLPPPITNNILSCAFDEGWFWFIPLHDGTTSVGAVVDVERYRDVAADDPESTYAGLVARCPEIAARTRQATRVGPVRVIRDYSYDSTRFHGRGWLMAGDAACFIDPVFSTGVHLACLSGFLGARAVDRVLGGAAREDEALADFERGYRGAFERYLRFLTYFYDHNTDPDSYFWTARRLLTHSPEDLDTRQAFVRLMSGGGDWDALPEVVEREHARLAAAIRAERIAAVPGADAFRVRTTERLLQE
jgi:halogenation protein CepH